MGMHACTHMHIRSFIQPMHTCAYGLACVPTGMDVATPVFLHLCVPDVVHGVAHARCGTIASDRGCTPICVAHLMLSIRHSCASRQGRTSNVEEKPCAKGWSTINSVQRHMRVAIYPQRFPRQMSSLWAGPLGHVHSRVGGYVSQLSGSCCGWVAMEARGGSRRWPRLCEIHITWQVPGCTHFRPSLGGPGGKKRPNPHDPPTHPPSTFATDGLPCPDKQFMTWA